MAGDKTGNGDGGKSDGDDDKVGGQATASNGEGGRRLMATRAMTMVTKMWVMATVTRLAGDEEGKRDEVGDGVGDEGGVVR